MAPTTHRQQVENGRGENLFGQQVEELNNTFNNQKNWPSSNNSEDSVSTNSSSSSSSASSNESDQGPNRAKSCSGWCVFMWGLLLTGIIAAIILGVIYGCKKQNKDQPLPDDFEDFKEMKKTFKVDDAVPETLFRKFRNNAKAADINPKSSSCEHVEFVIETQHDISTYLPEVQLKEKFSREELIKKDFNELLKIYNQYRKYRDGKYSALLHLRKDLAAILVNKQDMTKDEAAAQVSEMHFRQCMKELGGHA